MFPAEEPQLLMAPMVTFASRPDGHISPDEVPYLELRARGGFDWIVTGACCVHPSGWAFPGQWLITGPEFVPSIRLAAEAIHRGGSRAILQIHHGGRQAPSSLCGGPVSASAVAAERKGAETPRSLEIHEIQEIVQAFAQAAKFAEDAGFDGVEIHGANTYLLQQFVSPHSNRREDAYGQDRLRFSEEVTRAVLDAVGGRLVVGYRFSPEEPETPGLRLADTFGLLDRLAPLGLDYVHASLKHYAQPPIHDPSAPSITSLLVQHLDGRVPLVVAGAVTTWADRDAALSLGAHSVAVGRMALLNPEWPRLAKAERSLRWEAPETDAATELTLPAGLASRMHASPSWFKIERSD